MTPRRDARTIVLATPHDVHGWTGLELELAGQWPTPVPGIVAPSTLEERDAIAVVMVDGSTVHVRVPVRTHGRTRWTTVATGAIRDHGGEVTTMDTAPDAWCLTCDLPLWEHGGHWLDDTDNHHDRHEIGRPPDGR